MPFYHTLMGLNHSTDTLARIESFTSHFPRFPSHPPFSSYHIYLVTASGAGASSSSSSIRHVRLSPSAGHIFALLSLLGSFYLVLRVSCSARCISSHSNSSLVDGFLFVSFLPHSSPSLLPSVLSSHDHITCQLSLLLPLPLSLPLPSSLNRFEVAPFLSPFSLLLHLSHLLQLGFLAGYRHLSYSFFLSFLSFFLFCLGLTFSMRGSFTARLPLSFLLFSLSLLGSDGLTMSSPATFLELHSRSCHVHACICTCLATFPFPFPFPLPPPMIV